MSFKTYPVRFGNHWRPGVADPPQVLVSTLATGGYIVCVQGDLACETPQALGKVRDDFYQDLCQVPPGAEPLELVVGGSKTRGGIRLEPYRIRLLNDQIAVRVIRGNRAPMSLHLTGLVYASSPSSFSSGTVSGVSVGNWVFLSGQVEVGNCGYTVLPWTLPPLFRPSTELEFPVIHNGLSMARVYPDGRVVIDSGIRVHDHASTDSAMFVRRGPVWLSSIRFSLSDGTSICVDDLCGNRNVSGEKFTVYLQPGLALLQGRIVHHSHSQQTVVPREFESSIGVALLAKLPVAPATSLSFFVLNKTSTPEITDRYSRVVIDPLGQVWGAGFDPGVVRIVSLSGIVFCPSTSSGQQDQQPMFQSLIRCWSPFEAAVAQAVFDFSIRRKIQLDIGRLSTLLIRPAIAGLKAESRLSPWAAWRKKNALKSVSEISDLADLIVRSNLLTLWRLDKLVDRIALFMAKLVVEPDVPGSTMEIVQRAFYQQSARASLLETMRFNGRKCMHQLKIAKAANPEEIEILNETVNWWHMWSSNDKNLTHSSLMGNQDIFTDTGKWTVPDDADVQDQLFKYMAWIFKKGYDTFISEIQTPLFPLIEDLDMESTLPMTDTRQIDDMFTEKLFFIKERARALRIIYPHINEFTVYLYTSSGFNKSKGRWKSSFHLVWPDIIVNGHLAPIVRQTTVEYFIYKSATSAYFKHMQARLVNHYDANIWENVFDQTTSNAANGLRMPFSNKASWVKTNFGTKVPSVENRHCFPKGEIKIVFTPKEFESDVARSAAATRAMTLITEAEARDKSELGKMTDQNQLVGDRTQIKQSDKNTIHRTSAFFAGMKSAGGDLREFYDIDAHWVETVEDAHALSEENVARWIKRGSCRRNMAQTRLTSYDTNFVECYEKADLEFFEGHTIETLRETELWSKMTPVCQAGLKARFRKYLQASTSSSNYVKTGLYDVARLAVMARTRPVQESHQFDEFKQFMEEDDDIDGLEMDEFEYWPDAVDNVFFFPRSISEFVRLMEDAIEGGQWVHTALSATYITNKSSKTNGWSSCLQIDYSSGKRNDQVFVSHYYHCGKVIVMGKEGPTLSRVVEAMKSFCEPDNRLYHRLGMPSDSSDGFPLIDADKALHQRQEYERRWAVIKEMDQEASIDLLT